MKRKGQEEREFIIIMIKKKNGEDNVRNEKQESPWRGKRREDRAETAMMTRGTKIHPFLTFAPRKFIS